MTGWLIAGASARGASHVRGGRPNQDAFAILPDTGAASARIVGVVSDGHGAAPHFRSQIGSRIAADGASRLLAWEVDQAGGDGSEDEVPQQIVGHWRDAVAAHFAANPFSEAEALIARGDAFTAYGATLVGFALTADVFVALQIGDGDLMLGYPDGRITAPIAPDSGLIGEETYSLCLPDAVTRFRSAHAWRGDAGWPDFVCATTDGVAKSFHSDEGFAEAIGLLRRNAISDWMGLVEALPDWLSELSEQGSGDDATITIALDTNTTRGS